MTNNPIPHVSVLYILLPQTKRFEIKEQNVPLLMSICNRQSTVTVFEQSMITVGKVSLVLLGLAVSLSWKGKDFIELSKLFLMVQI